LNLGSFGLELGWNWIGFGLVAGVEGRKSALLQRASEAITAIGAGLGGVGHKKIKFGRTKPN
jgi:hypothetical protein